MIYDLICIGGGVTNLPLAYVYLKNNPNKKVLIIEKGNDILTRSCPKAKLGYCANCNPCHITYGIGGSGCFSDSKQTFSTEVGGTLINYVGKEKFEELQEKAKTFYDDLGATSPIIHNGNFFNTFNTKCKEVNLRLVDSKVRHLGTEGSYKLIVELYNRLLSMGCEIKCRTTVKDVDFKNKLVEINKGQLYKYNKLVIAVGRGGSSWLNSICKTNNIKLEENTVDIGVRVELPANILDPITDNLYEMKIVNQLSGHSSVRTFCVNPRGYVVEEGYGDVKCVNGHSFADTKSNNSNFALLHSIRFTEPFNNPIEYGKSICTLANKLGGDKILVQRLEDILLNRRTNENRLSNNSVIPTLKDCVGGNLGYALPYTTLKAIVDTLYKLDKVIPGVYNGDILLYAPEIKFYSSKIDLNDKLQVKDREDLKDVYFLGDSSGVTHGIIQATMSGIYTAENLLDEEEN